MKKRLVAILFLWLSFLFTAKEVVAAETRPDPLYSYLRQGIECSFNLDHAGAISAFQKVVDLKQDSPTGYAFFALAWLFSYETNFDPKEREKSQGEMLRYIGEAITRGRSRSQRIPEMLSPALTWP